MDVNIDTDVLIELIRALEETTSFYDDKCLALSNALNKAGNELEGHLFEEETEAIQNIIRNTRLAISDYQKLINHIKELNLILDKYGQCLYRGN